ncbi:MAG: murein transglycosylase [Gemmatimonadetes bacterium]|nr:murein transglycosylase [Gemmatimonadota bacterium]NIQ51956.1 murein transglycosylase [Gemmatimonadota bacterium]NIU72059.1 murein transglycosylase [Gammaproteobacteria bacterium]NIX42619.1 murein transglycosylase [Gemmatimonadota bacterium]
MAGPEDEGEPAVEAADTVPEAAPEPAEVEPTWPGSRRVVGRPGFRAVGRGGEPRVERLGAADRAGLLAALEGSLRWFEKPSSREYYPAGVITHERARASVFAFRELVERIEDPVVLAEQIHQQFDFYESVGVDGKGTVLFTGYYAPTFQASRTQAGPYRHPLYRLPPDLAVDPSTGATLGRLVNDRVVPYPTRATIESTDLLAGLELAWLADPFEVYLVHVQGSAALSLPDGSTMHVGYAGNNGHAYESVARQLVEDGKIREDQLSLDEVRAYFEANPGDLEPYLRRNPRYVFFRELEPENWPAGSLGIPVTPLRSIATDKTEFPPGGVTLVITDLQKRGGGTREFEGFMLDQDSGDAIRTPGRADIYFGIGPAAEKLAGGQHSEGKLYYLFLNDERFRAWRAQMPPLD